MSNNTLVARAKSVEQHPFFSRIAADSGDERAFREFAATRPPATTAEELVSLMSAFINWQRRS